MINQIIHVVNNLLIFLLKPESYYDYLLMIGYTY
jgi:hypothetical protein